MARHRSQTTDGLSPVIVRLIKAARHFGQDSEGVDITGVPEALQKFGALAFRAIPIYGVFVPNRDEIALAIARVAREHFGMDDARGELREALKVVEEFDVRDPIESAANHVVRITEAAHFYAGLAFGIWLSDPSGQVRRR
jgi:hypothetical protein